MNNKSPLSKLPLSKVREFNYAEHHVLPGFQAKSISQVSRSLVGLHSARLPTPYVTLQSRMGHIETTKLQKELFIKRKLIKIRCMRKTLHTVPFDLAPIVHQATLHFRVADCIRYYKNNGISDKVVVELKKLIISLVKKSPSHSNTIIKYIQASSKPLRRLTIESKAQKLLIRVIVKHLWEEGVICYINTSAHWGSEHRLYGHTQSLYPELILNALSPEEAQKKLVSYHIDRYGPVTEKDISWWSGLSKRVIKQSLKAIKHDLVELEVEEFGDTIFYMKKANYHRMQSFEYSGEPWLALLAYEDSSLKGYFESRNRYVHSKYYNDLFNQIGEVRASIIVNGEAVGIWWWDKKEEKIVYDLFKKIRKNLQSKLEGRIAEMETYLQGAEKNKQLNIF